MKKKHFANGNKKRDQYTIVLEDLKSDFKVFGEGLDLVSNKIDRVEKDVGSLQGNVTSLSADVTSLRTDMEFVKSELAIIRHNQITRDEFKLLESRVTRLEKKVL